MIPSDEYIQAASQACLNVIVEDIALEAIGDGARDYGRRALASLQHMVTAHVDDSAGLDRLAARSSAFSQSYSRWNAEQAEQRRYLRQGLARFCWDASAVIVENDISTVLSFIQSDCGSYIDMTMTHASDLVVRNLMRHDRRPPSDWFKLSTEAYWKPVVRSAGGGTYFLRYAVSLVLIEQVGTIARLLMGLSDPDDLRYVECSEWILDLLKKENPLWTEKYQGRVQVFANLPQDTRLFYAHDQLVRDRELSDVFETGLLGVREVATNLDLVEKQAKALRRHLARAEEQVSRLQTEKRSLQTSLAAAHGKHRAAPVNRDGCIADHLAEIRSRDGEILRLQTALDEFAEKLLQTREFLSVVMTPAPDAGAGKMATLSADNPEEWRIVFVGGHERLHAKLRKRLCNAVFLHPDQNQFSPAVFDHADAVVFAVGYCSHALTYRAANEVRRRGTPAGYSHSTNVDIVIDEVREILLPAQGAMEAKAV